MQVVRGTAVCEVAVANGFAGTPVELCGAAALTGNWTATVTGSLRVGNWPAQWVAFSVGVAAGSGVRLWVDDVRLVDAWPAQPSTEPTTPALLPNVTLSAAREVAVRAELRPNGPTIALQLRWRADAGQAWAPVPLAALSPSTPPAEVQRRALQDKISVGWNTW